jgi:hypothetical protein
MQTRRHTMYTLKRFWQGIALVCCSSRVPSGRLPIGGRKSTGMRFDSSVIPTGTLRLDWEPLFPLGEILITPRALRALKTSAQHPLEFLAFHMSGYWGKQDFFGRYWNYRATQISPPSIWSHHIRES